VTSTVYRDPHGSGTVKFGTAVYRGYREYRPSLHCISSLSSAAVAPLPWRFYSCR